MTMSRIVLPCVMAAVALSLPAYAQPMGDHVTCYKVKDSAGLFGKTRGAGAQG